MQVDALLEALSTMRQRLMVVGGVFDAEQTRWRLIYISCMRDNVLSNDSRGFADYCQHMLAGVSGDTMSDLLDELWEQLGLGCETATWDDFAQKFL